MHILNALQRNYNLPNSSAHKSSAAYTETTTIDLANRHTQIPETQPTEALEQTQTHTYVNENGERIMMIQTPHGIQYIKIGEVEHPLLSHHSVNPDNVIPTTT